MSDRQTTHFDKAVAAFLFVARRKAGYTQATLAKRLEISSAQMQKYEAGRNRLSLSTFHKMLGILKLDANEVFTAAEDLMEPANSPKYLNYKFAPPED